MAVLPRRRGVAGDSPSGRAARGIGTAGAGRRRYPADTGGVICGGAVDASFLIAEADSTRCCHPTCLLRDFAGYSARADYTEKEQSNDSTDTDL
jgi:hypothetical protein